MDWSDSLLVFPIKNYGHMFLRILRFVGFTSVLDQQMHQAKTWSTCFIFAVSISGSLTLFSMHFLAAASHSVSLFMPAHINFSRARAELEIWRDMTNDAEDFVGIWWMCTRSSFACAWIPWCTILIPLAGAKLLQSERGERLDWKLPKTTNNEL